MIILENRVEGLSAETLRRFVLHARRAVRLSGNVNVLLTGDAEMPASLVIPLRSR